MHLWTGRLGGILTKGLIWAYGMQLILYGGNTMRIIKDVNTRMFADDDSHATTLTIDFTGLSQEDVYEIAAQAAIVKWQSNARRMKVIPEQAEYKVPKPGTRSSGVSLTPENLVARYGSVEAAVAALMAIKK